MTSESVCAGNDDERAIPEIDLRGSDVVQRRSAVEDRVGRAPVGPGGVPGHGRCEELGPAPAHGLQAAGMIGVVVGQDHVRGFAAREPPRLLGHPLESLVRAEGLDEDDAAPTRDDPAVAKRLPILEWAGREGPDTLAEAFDGPPGLGDDDGKTLLGVEKSAGPPG